jgi:hypothetical protein
VVGAAVLDHAQAARRDLIVDAVVEQDHRIRDVLLESLPGQGAIATLARDDGGDALVLQPPEQPSQLRPEDGVVLQAGKQRFDGVEDDAPGSDGPNRVVEPDEQPFEIVLACFLDLAAFHAHVVDRELLRLDQLREVEAERRDVAGNLLGVLLERHEHAGFIEINGAVHQKGERQQRLAGSRPPADERRPAGRQPATRDLVEAVDSRSGFCELPAAGQMRQHTNAALWLLHASHFIQAQKRGTSGLRRPSTARRGAASASSDSIVLARAQRTLRQLGLMTHSDTSSAFKLFNFEHHLDPS